MRNSVLASGSIHLVLLAVLFAVRPPHSIMVPGPDVVQVALLDTSATVAVTPPPPPAPEVKPEPTPVAPTEESGVKIAPTPPKKKPKAQAEEQAPQQPATTLPYAPAGNAGLRGQVSVDTNFEFAYYLNLVRNRVAQAWAPPAGLTSGGQPVHAVVYFKIARDGGVSALRIETGSGFEFFDRSAARAVQLSDPMPPLPLGYTGGDLGVHFGFEFVAP